MKLFPLLLITSYFHIQIISPYCSINKCETKSNNQKCSFCQKSFFSVIPQFSGGRCLARSVNRFDLSLLENIFHFHGSLKETVRHGNRDSQSFCQEKLLFLFSRALRSRDGDGEFPADVSFFPGETINPQATDFCSMRSGFEIYQQIFIDWLRTQVQGFFYLTRNGKTQKKKEKSNHLLFHFPRTCSEHQLNSYPTRFRVKLT